MSERWDSEASAWSSTERRWEQNIPGTSSGDGAGDKVQHSERKVEFRRESVG